MTPNLEHIQLAAKYLKNAAIAAGRTGGLITIANTFSNNKENSKKVYISNATNSLTTGIFILISKTKKIDR